MTEPRSLPDQNYIRSFPADMRCYECGEPLKPISMQDGLGRWYRMAGCCDIEYVTLVHERKPLNA